MANERLFSQLYSFKYTNLDGNIDIPLETSPYSKYVPFNYVMVTNNTDVDITLLINGNIEIIVESGAVMTIDGDTIPAIRSIRVSTSTASTGDIYVRIQKVKRLKRFLERIEV